MRIRSFVAASAICAAAPLSPLAAAAQPVPPGEPQISVYLRSIGEDGRTGGWAGDTRRFAVGEPFTQLLVAGNLVSGDSSICSSGAYSSSTLEELVTRYAHVWRLTVTPLEYAAGQQKAQLDWARFRAGDPSRPAASGSRELTLREGESQILDVLARDSSTRCGTVAVLLDVSAGFSESASYADAMLQYELWLVHTTRDGERTTRRFVTMGSQGAEMPYAFGSIRFPLPALSGATRRYDVTTGIGGTIRGRIASDGRILIELSTNRRDALTLQHEAPRRVGPAGGRGYVESAGGRKYLQLAPGETVGIKIPAKTGFMSARAGDAPLSGSGRVALRGSDAAAMTAKQTQPVEVVNGSIRVYFKPFFEGHETSLILKVRRVE